jgi:acyl-CoA synthetase (AMP-forming)/AMP-acid ligase II
MNFKDILAKGVTIASSGTTGAPKKIFRTPENLKSCVEIALDSQKITSKSKVLTVTRMTHAGGLLAQSLPAYYAGAELKIQTFNPYTFLKDFNNYTHTFLTPDHMKSLMNTKEFKNCDLSGKWILTGSNPVSWDIIKAFVYQGATVQPNWGMSEIGPIVINSTFNSLLDVYEYKYKIKGGFILGDNIYCDVKVKDNKLFVKGPTCYKSGWLDTKDIVTKFENIFCYVGRE